MSTETDTKIKFIEKAAKAVWAFICAFAFAFVSGIVTPLFAGRFPTMPEYLASVAMGLVAAFGTGSAVYSVTNKEIK